MEDVAKSTQQPEHAKEHPELIVQPEPAAVQPGAAVRTAEWHAPPAFADAQSVTVREDAAPLNPELAHWNGFLYFNKAGPLWVAKRWGWGYTINFGHRAAPWILLAITVVPSLILSFAIGSVARECHDD